MKRTASKYYKLLLAIAFIAFTAFTLHSYALLIRQLLAVEYNWLFELGIVSGMLLFQFPFIAKQETALQLEYYFNMLLVSFSGALLLWPLIITNYFQAQSAIVNVSYFFAVVLCMFFMHKKMVTGLKLPPVISYTWVLYRVIILLLII